MCVLKLRILGEIAAAGDAYTSCIYSVSNNFCLELIDPSARYVFIFGLFGRERRVEGRVRRGKENMAEA